MMLFSVFDFVFFFAGQGSIQAILGEGEWSGWVDPVPERGSEVEEPDGRCADAVSVVATKFGPWCDISGGP